MRSTAFSLCSFNVLLKMAIEKNSNALRKKNTQLVVHFRLLTRASITRFACIVCYVKGEFRENVTPKDNSL
jgi:hypothetical protein